MANHKRKSWCPSFKGIVKWAVTAWMLLNIIKDTTASAAEFPESGNYKQQSDFVNSLTHPCDYEIGRVVTDIAEAENPFARVEAHAEGGKNVKVWHHDFDKEFGVVTKRTKETAKESTSEKTADVEEVMIGGESLDGTLQPITFKFQRGKDGLMRPVAKTKVPVTEFAEGIEHANKEGLVVRADTCYAARLRDKARA